jgi:hypothetical protein
MMARLALVALVATTVAAWEPEDEVWEKRRELQHSSGGHSSSGHSSGGHSSSGHSSGGHGSSMRRADTTQTGCTPPGGPDLPKTVAGDADPINEPCYVHDAACEGYPVCCVLAGTCVDDHGGMVSSNTKYYMGGCVSPNSRAGALPDGCAKQGECHAMYLEHMKGGTTGAGLAGDVSPYVTEAMMQGATGCEDFWTPPMPIYGYILIGVGALVVVIVLLVVVKMMCCKPKTGKGAPDDASVQA